MVYIVIRVQRYIYLQNEPYTFLPTFYTLLLFDIILDFCFAFFSIIYVFLLHLSCPSCIFGAKRKARPDDDLAF